MLKNNPGPVSALRVDMRGLLLDANDDVPVDVLFDGQRVFSFWTMRDTQPADAARLMTWPDALRRFLDGSVTVGLASPVTGTVLVEAGARLGDSEERIRVQDKAGNPMGLDKSMRLSRLFGDSDIDQMTPLLDAMDVVLGALEKAGVEPFVAYGTLLGAVRDQNFIGHDSDADLGYVSAWEHPVDAIRESMQLQRILNGMGFVIQRYSGMGFKVVVREANGGTRGLDVFGGFMTSGRLYLMGEVGEDFRREWLYPRQPVTLAGRQFPGPAVPEHLLAAMYGPSWRVPDPAFKFTTPTSTVRRLDGWFRGTRTGLDERWEARRRSDETQVCAKVSGFAREVAAQVPDAGLMVDVGCGTGRDILFLARRGHRAIGLEFFPPDLRIASRRAQQRGSKARFRWCNLGELRSVLLEGAALSREEGPRTMLAHHVADATTRQGRKNLLRLAKMVTRDSGRLHVQFYTKATESSRALALRPVAFDVWRRMVEDAGGRIEQHRRLTESEAGVAGAPVSTEPTIDRMAVTWRR